MIAESRLEPTEHGLVPKGDGWFVLNAREARWLHTPGRSAICEFEGYAEGEQDFQQLGLNLSVLQPGESMGLYHWEADQEDFLVLAGEALLIVEGEERLLRQWDFVHCPAGTKHIILGLRSERAPTPTSRVGAATRSTKPRSATTSASSGRRATPSRRTRGSRGASRPATPKAGCPT